MKKRQFSKPLISFSLTAVCIVVMGCSKVSNILDTDFMMSDTTDSESDTATQSTREACISQGLTPYTSLDLLLVVDNSGSMSEEQEILATAIYNLINALTNPVGGGDIIDDVRIGITTSDMGVSHNGTPYEDVDGMFDNAQVKCHGMGDGGLFVTEYTQSGVTFMQGQILCDASGDQCPVGKTCENQNARGIGVCMDPDGAGVVTPCSPSPGDLERTVIDSSSGNIALSTACIASQIGTEGCNYEQQLKAAIGGLNNNHDFVRADSLTAVIIVSDESDCSIKTDEWHKLDELKNVNANLACGRHPEYMHNVAALKNVMESTKTAAGGDAEDIVFSAIAGVPMVPACQGAGDTIGDCFSVKPGVNGEGTMEAPDEVSRTLSSGVVQYYFEYACQRFAANAAQNDRAITSAYPGTRYLQMAQLFADRGYIYSICNSDWTPAMDNIARIVRENVKVVCVE